MNEATSWRFQLFNRIKKGVTGLLGKNQKESSLTPVLFLLIPVENKINSQGSNHSAVFADLNKKEDAESPKEDKKEFEKANQKIKKEEECLDNILSLVRQKLIEYFNTKGTIFSL